MVLCHEYIQCRDPVFIWKCYFIASPKTDKQSALFCLKAKLVCQRGLHVGSSAVTTLGDPAKGKSEISISSLQDEVGFS